MSGFFIESQMGILGHAGLDWGEKVVLFQSGRES